jgi:hypothetical protein
MYRTSGEGVRLGGIDTPIDGISADIAALETSLRACFNKITASSDSKDTDAPGGAGRLDGTLA